MIRFLEGVLEEKEPARLVLRVGGVGYEIFIPLSSYDPLPPTGGTCRLQIYDCVREDAHDLFGFLSSLERRLFVLLLGVNGIGPKMALNALSGLSPRDLVAAIAGGDVKRLASISGIGKKKAERIVVELRDRITEGEALAAATSAEAGPEDIKRRDAILALISLGYKQVDATRLLQQTVTGPIHALTVEDLVRRALSGTRD
jgi:Holliday junction DNA helicase RuvA